MASEVDLHEVCKRAASRLGIDWPASLEDKGEERYLYDGKNRLTKQVMPAVLASMREMKWFWDKPFCHRGSIKGSLGLEVVNRGGVGSRKSPGGGAGSCFPPPPQPLVRACCDWSCTSGQGGALHRLHVPKSEISSPVSEQLTVSVVTLLTAYQAKLFQEMGLLKGSPSPD